MRSGMEDEYQPLIEHFHTKKRRRCMKIPFQTAVTFAVVGLFLLVVLLLVALDKSNPSPEKQLAVVKEKLDSSIGNIQELIANSRNEEEKNRLLRKSKYTEDNYPDIYKDIYTNYELSLGKSKVTEKGEEKSKKKDEQATENYGDVLETLYTEIKAKQKNVEDKLDFIQNILEDDFLKSAYIEENGSIKKKDAPKESKDLSLQTILTSPRKTENTDEDSTEKYNDFMDKFEDLLKKKQKILEEKLEKIKSLTRDLKNDLLKAAYDVEGYAGGKKEEITNELLDLQKFLKLDSEESDSKDDELLSSLFSFGKKIYSSPNSGVTAGKYKNHKFDNVEKGWKKTSNLKGNTVYRGCPYRTTDSSSDAAELIQTYVNCANLAEDMRKEYGKCIDITFLPKECKPSYRQKCFSTYKYRKIDGSCNNRFNPTWGMSNIPYVRMIAPDYSDDISAFRLSKDGSALPNPRALSEKLYTKLKKGNIDTSLLFVFFGLFVDHDMVETALALANIDCCKHHESFPKECMPVLISRNDSFYGSKNVTCLNVLRSLPTTGECAGRREQMNRATSFLDGSAIYGSTISKAKSLRSFHDGQLKTQWINNTPFMEQSKIDGYSCGTHANPLKCFATGDLRANMLVDLTAMHTLWYREHNRIATILSQLNPQWTDETVYQEARKIVIGELQHIAYNEFLPMLLGDEAMDYFGLKVNQDEGEECDSIYDETVNPSVFNSFGAAAFRFGHSLAQDVVELLDSSRNKTQIPLHTTFFNVQLLWEKGLDKLLRGATTQKIRAVDSFITNEIRDHLFQSEGEDHGFDLSAIGLLRGRDHGIPSYVKWRSACGLSEINSWEDLNEVMDTERALNLKESYKFVEDIDFAPGALAEYHVDGAMIGPTHLCVIGRQFRKTRKGDRFWYENKDSFSKEQLEEIYHSSFARIICEDSDAIKQIQRYPFQVPSDENPLVDCEDIPKIDLSKWAS